MSFKLIRKLSISQFILSIFILIFLILFITLLAIKINDEHKYKIPGYIFLGLFLFAFLINLTITILISIKINQIEKYSQIQFEGWFYLIGGCIFCWLSFLNQNTIYKLTQNLIKDEIIDEKILG